MNSSKTSPPVQPPRSEIILLLAAAVLATLPFWFSDLDIRLARLFYFPGHAGTAWPMEFWPLWRFFYHAAPVVSALLGLGALLWLGYIQITGQQWSLRPYLLLVFLTFLIGSGLLVNGLFKDHWRHPRPRQTVELGGDKTYVPPLAIGRESGKSFPSGHASVGFALVSLWFVWRRRRFGLALFFLLASIALGLTMGMGRMAAGGHYFSDVLWSGIILYATAFALYYYVLKIPRREAALLEGQAPPPARRRPVMGWLYVLAGAALLAFSLFGIPLSKDLHDERPANGIRHVQLLADQADVRIEPVDGDQIRFEGAVRSFGFPNNRVQFDIRQPTPDTLAYRLRHQGLYSEIDTRLHLMVPRTIDSATVELARGNIVAPASGPPVMRLKTARGEVRRGPASKPREQPHGLPAAP